MLKKNQNRILVARRLPVALVVAAVMIVAGLSTHGFGVFAASCSSSSDCQAQIDNLNSQNGQAQSQLTTLEAQAGSYQAAIAALQGQINSLQTQINANTQQQQQLNQQISDNQKELDKQKGILANDIKTMYVSGQVTPIEMLATSKNLSEYIDKQQAYSAVQDKIQDTMTKIADLQNQLKAKKAQVDQLLATLGAQQDQLGAAQNEQNSLLSYNQSQQDAFNAQIQTNKKALSQLYAQQLSFISASFGGGYHYGGTGGYPYDGAVCLNYGGDCGAWSASPYNWGVNGQPYDPAGWQYRNCTSYAFWRLNQTTGITLSAGYFPAVYNSGGRIKYSVLGNDFQNLGYRVDHDPSGSVVLAVNTAGNYGHIMYVENVINGQAYVSQYNAAGDGRYSTAGPLINSSNIWFIHIR